MTISPHQKKILIVDDNPTNIEVLYLHLEQVGYTVLVADDGYEALKIAPNTQPDLIILDVMMPGIDGFEVATTLKSDPTTADIPIIFMTALTDITNKVNGFNVGGVDYITKPFQHREVLVRVQTQLTLRQQQQELKIHVRKLQEQNEDLDAFAHTIAHDLKNPLNRKNNDSYGLGLSIAKRIIEKLGGKIGVSASNKQGSEFYFTLPA